MADSFEEILRLVRDLAKKDDYESANNLLNKIKVNDPYQEARIWVARGHLSARMRNYRQATDYVSKAIERCDQEPYIYFDRGRYYFKSGNYLSAITDFGEVIKLCDVLKSDYYTEAAYFFRADAYVRIGEYEKAKKDCEHLQDGARLWTDTLKTKEQILSQCAQND